MPPNKPAISAKPSLLERLGNPFGLGKPRAEILGISGTTNWSGDIQKEENQILRGSSAYGIAGSPTWGEWERILRTDPDVSSAIEFTKAQIRDCRVSVEEFAATTPEGKALAKAQADFVRWCLLERCAPGWPELKNQLCGALVPGFSLHELIWERITHSMLPGGEGYGITALQERLPQSIELNGWVEKNGELSEIKQMGQKPDGTYGLSILPADKVLLFSWNRSGNNYLGFSAFRAVWYLCKIRAELLKLAGISLSREGAGIPIAVAQNNDAILNEAQRSDLIQMLANIQYHENSSAVMPVGWDIKWIYSPGANKGHVLDAWSQLGKAILRQVFAMQLSLGADSSSGSRAVGEVHDGTADSFVQGVLAGIEGAINGAGHRPYEGLPRKLIEANWGPQAGYPKIKLELKQAKINIETKANAVQTLVTAGALTLTLEDENSLREGLGLAPITAEIRDAKRVAPPVQPAAAFAFADQSAPFIPGRPLRFAEQRLDLQRQSKYLATARDSFERQVRPVVVEMLVSALPEIKGALADGRPSDVAEIPLDASRLAEIIRKHLRAARVEGAAQVEAEFKAGNQGKIAEARASGVVAMASKKPDGDDEIEEETDEQLEAEEKLLSRRIKNRLAQELENEAMQGQRTGADASEMIRNVVARQLETGAFKGDAGVITTTAWNLGREEAAEKLGTKRVQYSAILDVKVCGPCADLDGEEWEFNSPEHNRYLPPNRDCEGGYRCRCMLIYLSEGDE